MPATSRVFVKASLIYLGLGAVLGALLLINRWVFLGTEIGSLRVSHAQFLIVGWLTQLILGVAWWLFPPLAIGLRPGSPRPTRRGQAQRGSESLISLNSGILLRSIFAPLYSWTEIELLNTLTGISGLFLLAAAITFVVNMWGRVRELGRQR
jgi:hypothetical protein